LRRRGKTSLSQQEEGAEGGERGGTERTTAEVKGIWMGECTYAFAIYKDEGKGREERVNSQEEVVEQRQQKEGKGREEKKGADEGRTSETRQRGKGRMAICFLFCVGKGKLEETCY